MTRPGRVLDSRTRPPRRPRASTRRWRRQAAGRRRAGGVRRGGVRRGSAEPNADGSAPAGHDVKGNKDSMLFHVPGSQWYDATEAEVWFADAAAAEAAGFKPAGGAASSRSTRTEPHGIRPTAPQERSCGAARHFRHTLSMDLNRPRPLQTVGPRRGGCARCASGLGDGATCAPLDRAVPGSPCLPARRVTADFPAWGLGRGAPAPTAWCRLIARLHQAVRGGTFPMPRACFGIVADRQR